MDAHTIIFVTLRALLQATSHPLFQKSPKMPLNKSSFQPQLVLKGDLVTTNM